MLEIIKGWDERQVERIPVPKAPANTQPVDTYAIYSQICIEVEALAS